MVRIRVLLFIFISLFFHSLFGQTAPNKYWVEFTDKSNSSFSVLESDQFLSQRAIERRLRYGIAVGEDDFPVNPNYLDSLRQFGAVVLTTSKWHNGATIFVADTNVMSQIRELSIVHKVQKNANVRPNRIPKDNSRLQHFSPINNFNLPELHLAQNKDYNDYCSYNYGNSYRQINMMNGDFLHQNGYCGSGMMIAVIDAGFWGVNQISAFDSLWANNQILGTFDLVDPSSNFFELSTHGMMVLSTMAGNNPGRIVGTAPKASYWLIRSEDADTEYLIEEDNYVAALEFADSVGVDVVNTSLGYTTFDNGIVERTYADMDGKKSRASLAATIAGRKGMIICNSAGNSGTNEWFHIGSPADADSIFAVGAVDEMRNVAVFSSRGPSYDGRVKPDVAAMGEQTIVINQQGNPVPANGTSFSSPVFAGSVACLWQAFPEKSNYEIMDAIRKSADRYNDPDSLTGYGIPDFRLAYQILNPNTSVNNEVRERKLSVSPNPFSENFSLQIFSDEDTFALIEFYDARGMQFFDAIPVMIYKGNNTIKIDDTSMLPSGLYFVKVTSKSVSEVIRVMKI
ncbi:MAG: T9SS type A sorting domain-containing protein [Sphingobacteriia bacterium]|nr:T9SS type A sorting domain-containing protein [Sphingobacteriia bacterium]